MSRTAGSRQTRVVQGRSSATSRGTAAPRRAPSPLGNQAMNRTLGTLARSGRARAKQDAAEHEADRVADAFTQGRVPPTPRTPAPAMGATLPTRAPAGRSMPAATGAGSALDPRLRASLEASVGADLADVRLHRDAAADALSRQLGALAVTVGRDVFFSRTAADPSTRAGRHLLTHEVTHTVQQALPGAAGPVAQCAPDPALEEERRGASSWNVGAETAILDEYAGFKPARDTKGRKRTMPAGTAVTLSPPSLFDMADERYVQVDWYDGEIFRRDWIAAASLVEFDDTYATPLDPDLLEAARRKIHPKIYDSTLKGKRFKDEALPYKQLAAGSYFSGKDTEALLGLQGDAYRAAANALLASKSLTDAQRALVERAMRFVDDGTLPAPKAFNEVGLDPELAGRLATFYRFLVQEGIAGANMDNRISGSRTKDDAHDKSTRWMLNPRNPWLNDPSHQLMLAQGLMKDRGADRSPPWATQEEVDALAPAVQASLTALAELSIARIVAKDMPAGAVSAGAVLGRKDVADALANFPDDIQARARRNFQEKWASWRTLMGDRPETFARFIAIEQQQPMEDLTAQRATIGAIVADIRARFGVKGVSQDAPALEGYPDDSPERFPNLTPVTQTRHLTGDAGDIHYDFEFNYFDPVVDALALVFGLRRAAISGSVPEHWHYQAVGEPLNAPAQVPAHDDEAAPR